METQVDEIAAGVYRLSTYTEAIAGGFTFNQFLLVGADALLVHTGPRQLWPSVSAGAAALLALADDYDRRFRASIAAVEGGAR